MLNSSTAGGGGGGGGVELDPSSAVAVAAPPPPDASALSTDDSDVPESLLAVVSCFSGTPSATFRSSSITKQASNQAINRTPCDRSTQPTKLATNQTKSA
uniref:Uncharacterized protein n=1 Tax=Leersia perrieri TaxID=77586 RepID=A0A0D9WC68_9ORYZ